MQSTGTRTVVPMAQWSAFHRLVRDESAQATKRSPLNDRELCGFQSDEKNDTERARTFVPWVRIRVQISRPILEVRMPIHAEGGNPRTYLGLSTLVYVGALPVSAVESQT